MSINKLNVGLSIIMFIVPYICVIIHHKDDLFNGTLCKSDYDDFSKKYDINALRLFQPTAFILFICAIIIPNLG